MVSKWMLYMQQLPCPPKKVCSEFILYDTYVCVQKEMPGAVILCSNSCGCPWSHFVALCEREREGECLRTDYP